MATDDDEVVLCTIKIDAGGVLSIHPDFNRGRKAYIAESNVDYARGKAHHGLSHFTKINWPK